MAEQPIDPNKSTNTSGSSLRLYCPQCNKEMPHHTRGAAHNSSLGKNAQAMYCSACGTMTDVPTDGFQANLDLSDGTDLT